MTEVETAVAIMVEMNRSAGAVLAILPSGGPTRAQAEDGQSWSGHN
jgi:hypothetical protein